MESTCCINIVKDELSKLGLHCRSVELGSADVKDPVSAEKLQMITTAFKKAGFEIINDNKTILVEKVRNAIHQLIYLSDDLPKQNFSDFISKRVNHDYSYLSFLFSGKMGVNIEKYIINERIQRVKELLVYNHLTLNEISYKLQYSSVSHLSNQFKKITGMTPTEYRQLGNSGIHKINFKTRNDQCTS